VGQPSANSESSLQARAPAGLEDGFRQIAAGLRDIARTLTLSLPRITFLPAFPPGCDTDTIVIALIQFVRVHQALLNILIGKSGLLVNGPIRREVAMIGYGAHVYERSMGRTVKRSENAAVGALVAAGLRAVEGVVDTLAFTVLKLIPTRGKCAKEQKEAIDGSLDETIKAYEQ
jgi:hypothetical protein